MKKPKMDWDRVREENLMRRSGSVSIFADPKPIKSIPWISDLMKTPNFPHSALGKEVRTKSFVGKITEILEDGSKIKITNKSKASKTFIVQLLRNVEKESPRKSKKKKNKKARSWNL